MPLKEGVSQFFNLGLNILRRESILRTDQSAMSPNTPYKLLAFLNQDLENPAGAGNESPCWAVFCKPRLNHTA